MADETFVIAKYDYKAQDGQELDLKKSEKLILLDDSKHWWKVQNTRNQSGFVPSNYVKRAKPSILTSLKNTLGRKRNSEAKPLNTSTPSLLRNGSAANSDQGSYSSDIQTCDNILAIAKFSYHARQLDELSLTKGERVIVIEKSSDGWWKGKKDSNVGWFPSNYVEIDVDDLQDTSLYASPADSSVSDVKNLDCLEMVVTLYPFTSSNSEELSFEKDETLEIIDKPAIDPEWWKARNQKGDIGLVPRNYVTTVSADSGFNQDTPESQSTSSLSGHSQGASSGTPSVILARHRVSGPFAEKDWYYGAVSRSECEHLLNHHAGNGDFLIRDSETNVSTVLTVFSTVRAAANESQKTLNKCETRNKTVFHTCLRHPETINSVPLNSVL